VISVLTVNSWEEALAIENANDFGNAACIYTSVGSHADWFAHRFKAGMIGVNVGVPVPREPFSFGGLYPSKSKYGDLDITGPGAMDFFSTKRKITTKWGALQPGVPVHAANGTPEATDKANFAGQM
jgi:acyl-CoA reductase-like NAD-dependent aldehyde dehydrogenase